MREWVAFEAALLVAWLGLGKWGLRSGTRGTIGAGRRRLTELEAVLVKEGEEALGGSMVKFSGTVAATVVSDLDSAAVILESVEGATDTSAWAVRESVGADDSEPEVFPTGSR